MFEEKTYEAIMERMLSRIERPIDKREGSMIWDAIAPMAAEMAQVYIDMDFLLNNTFADTAIREYLIRRAEERNVIPEAATAAVVKGIFRPDTLEIPIGARFSLDMLNYQVIRKISDGEYQLQCEMAGSEANTLLGTLIPIEVINGLEDAQVTEVLILGEDEEETEHFRERYFSSFNSQASGGNIAWYKETIHGMAGVGGVKILRAWNGPGSVKVIITDASFRSPTNTLINQVQTAIDPEQNQGEGLGFAPIGHVVTVTGAQTQSIHISSRITYQTDATFADIEAEAKQVLDQYLMELNASWEDTEFLIVRVSQIESRLLEVAGVVDIENTTINGTAGNYTLESHAIAVRGEFHEAS